MLRYDEHSDELKGYGEIIRLNDGLHYEQGLYDPENDEAFLSMSRPVSALLESEEVVLRKQLEGGNE